jgi:hypothetical protein
LTSCVIIQNGGDPGIVALRVTQDTGCHHIARVVGVQGAAGLSE